MLPVYMYKTLSPGFLEDLENFFGTNFFSAKKEDTITIPPVNILESGNQFIIDIAVPGMEKSDLKIDVEDKQLKISSEKDADQAGQGEQYTRREFSYGNFMRTFRLPDVADSENIEAKQEKGILRIIIPKKDQFVSGDTSKKIEVT